MRLNFDPVREERITLSELAENLSWQDLKELTIEMVELQKELISSCSDADVVFDPEDPLADDPFAERVEDISLPWTLGHVIVHVTASSEEAAAISAELARGVSYHGRSRYETPWQSITTIKHCNQRLNESLKMRLASLEMWPEEPHLENAYKSRPGAPAMNATIRFIYGLMHDDDHLNQISQIIQQAQQVQR
jgi:hypothetical protein